MSPEQILIVILRVIGTSSLLAIFFVAVPNDWMAAIHAELGMGTLPDAPVVSYLARTTSALYAILGGLFWLLSFDIPRYRPVLVYLGTAISVFGVALLIVDWAEQLPLFWKVWEGPFLIVFGLVMRTLARRIAPEADR